VVVLQTFDLPRFGPSGPVSRDLASYETIGLDASGSFALPSFNNVLDEVFSPPSTSFVSYGYVSQGFASRSTLNAALCS
jgi:hypothetical protein